MNLGKKISIVIVNWNTGFYLQKCLKSILKNKNNFINKIVVVDNASTDNSHKIIPRSKKIILLKNKNNLGFARACNQGAALSKSKYILFLNPDTRLLKNTLKKVLIFMERPANSNIGICGVKMIIKKNFFAHSVSRFPTVFNMILRSIGLDIFFPNSSLLNKHFNYNKSGIVDQVIGAFFLIRSNIFKALQGFDEIFFLYMDEVDLSYRVKQMGYFTYYLHNAFCFHKGGVSSSKALAFRQFNYHKSRILYSMKYFNPFGVIIIIISTFTIEFILRFLKSLFIFPLNSFVSNLISYFLLIKWIFSLKN